MSFSIPIPHVSQCQGVWVHVRGPATESAESAAFGVISTFVEASDRYRFRHADPDWIRLDDRLKEKVARNVVHFDTSSPMRAATFGSGFLAMIEGPDVEPFVALPFEHGKARPVHAFDIRLTGAHSNSTRIRPGRYREHLPRSEMSCGGRRIGEA